MQGNGEDILTEGSECWVDLLPDTTGCRVSWEFSHSPHRPTHAAKTEETHLYLVEHRESPNDTRAEGGKQRDASCGARADVHTKGSAWTPSLSRA